MAADARTNGARWESLKQALLGETHSIEAQVLRIRKKRERNTFRRSSMASVTRGGTIGSTNNSGGNGKSSGNGNNSRNNNDGNNDGNNSGNSSGGVLPTEGSGELRHDTMSRPAIPKSKRKKPKKNTNQDNSERSWFDPIFNIFGGGGGEDEEENMGSLSQKTSHVYVDKETHDQEEENKERHSGSDYERSSGGSGTFLGSSRHAKHRKSKHKKQRSMSKDDDHSHRRTHRYNSHDEQPSSSFNGQSTSSGAGSGSSGSFSSSSRHHLDAKTSTPAGTTTNVDDSESAMNQHMERRRRLQ